MSGALASPHQFFGPVGMFAFMEQRFEPPIGAELQAAAGVDTSAAAPRRFEEKQPCAT